MSQYTSGYESQRQTEEGRSHLLQCFLGPLPPLSALWLSFMCCWTSFSLINFFPHTSQPKFSSCLQARGFLGGFPFFSSLAGRSTTSECSARKCFIILFLELQFIPQTEQSIACATVAPPNPTSIIKTRSTTDFFYCASPYMSRTSTTVKNF